MKRAKSQSTIQRNQDLLARVKDIKAEHPLNELFQDRLSYIIKQIRPKVYCFLGYSLSIKNPVAERCPPTRSISFILLSHNSIKLLPYPCQLRLLSICLAKNNRQTFRRTDVDYNRQQAVLDMNIFPRIHI